MITLVRLGAFFDPLAIFWVFFPVIYSRGAGCRGPCPLNWYDYVWLAALVMPIVIGVAAVITLIRRDAWIRLRTFERGLALAEIAIGLIFAFLLGTTLPALPTLLERSFVHR